MSQLSKVRAWLLRRAVGVIGPGKVQDIIDLFAFMGDAITYGHGKTPSATGEYRYLDDGRARIKLPHLVNERAVWQVGLHELGHYLCEDRPLGETVLPTGAAALLAEQDADDFADCFLLPDEAVEAIQCMADAYELADDYGIPLEWIERRKDTLRRYGPTDVHSPPSWSAWRHYRVGKVNHPQVPRFSLVPASEHALPLEIPISRGLEAPLLRSIHWDLASLRLHEFLHKYRAHSECPPWECAGMHFEELIPPKRKPRRNWRY